MSEGPFLVPFYAVLYRSPTCLILFTNCLISFTTVLYRSPGLSYIVHQSVLYRSPTPYRVEEG